MRKRLIALALAGLMTTAEAQPVPAQRAIGPRAGLTQTTSTRKAAWERSVPTDSLAPNEWKRGVAIGAGIGAALGLFFYSLESRLSDNGTHPEVILGTALVLGLIGGMIGSSIHKK